MGDNPRILIVGAGIAGLALAAGLECHGTIPTVVEVENAPVLRGLVLMLTSNGVLALRRIGLDRMVIDRGIMLEHIAQTDASGTLMAQHDLRPSNDRFAPNLGITRDGLMSGLSRGLRARIRYATTITSVAGSAGAARRRFLRWNARSVRSRRGSGWPTVGRAPTDTSARQTGLSVILRMADRDGMLDRDPVFRIGSSPGRLLGSFPVARDRVYAFLLAHTEALPCLSRAEHLARFKELVSVFQGTVPALIRELHNPADVIFVPVHEVRTPSYYRGLVLVIGDAAHAFSPLLAQGAAMAIEDAVALAELIGESGDIHGVVRSYESSRRPRVETIRAAVRHRTISRGLEGPVTGELLRRHRPVFSPSLKVSSLSWASAMTT